jgi:4-hydroxybenzoate polyprenyltransferase
MDSVQARASGQTTGDLRPARASAVVYGCLRLLRVKQWIKNVFVLGPLLFAGRLTQWASARTALWAFISFCLLSSSLYVVNDWLDREQDRAHPQKGARPIASGLVPGVVAWPLALVLFMVAVALAYITTNGTVVALQLAYAAVHLLYSLFLKNVVILDVFVIAIGFVIRVWAGAYAIFVEASHWIVLCTLLLALFLGLSKRKKEIILLSDESAKHRPVLVRYSLELITQMNLITCAAIVVCYAIYTVAPETILRFGTDHLVYSVPFVIYGLFRCLLVMQREETGGDPTELLLRDRPLILVIVMWIGYCFWVVYGSRLTGFGA